MQKIKKTLLTIILIMSALTTYSQTMTLEVQAPRVVNVGETFRMSFITNSKVDNFIPPSIEGFRVIAGPAQSTSNSVSIVNGKVTQSTSISFSYTISAEQEGKFTIGSAKVKHGGQEARTQPFAIECVKESNPPQGGSSAQKTANADGRGIFVNVVLSKREVYLGESLVASTKLYVRGTAVAGIESVKLPVFNGFWTQEMNVPQQIRFERENVKGIVYDAGLLNQQLLFPQQVGELTISGVEVDIIEQTRTRSRDIFDDFFGGGVQNIRKKVVSSAQKIKVKDLPPGAPPSFTGAVGDFKISASLSKQQLMANDATSLTIRVSGKGNLKLINTPKVSLPVDFETYDAKTTESIKNTSNGSEGYRQFEVPIIPRSAGIFTIAAIEFSYFNPSTAKYVTLHTKSFNIEVDKDTKNTQHNYASVDVRRENLKIVGQDIRFIKNTRTLKNENKLFFASTLYFACYILLTLLFIILYLYLDKQIKENKNEFLVRNKKARKIAKKRLDSSKHLLKAGNTQGFYDELLRAMWGYLGDKLGVPAAELSQEKVVLLLTARGIEESYIQIFIKIIHECEFTRYAPSTNGQQVMQYLYTDAVEVISKLEQRIK
ncbi:MAG: BatD family protein [Bacteroidales bacterium]